MALLEQSELGCITALGRLQLSTTTCFIRHTVILTLLHQFNTIRSEEQMVGIVIYLCDDYRPGCRTDKLHVAG